MAAPSLVLSGFGELCHSNGATLAYLARPGGQQFDFGGPAVETASVTRILGDGDVVTGSRSGNRVLVLPLLIPAGLGATLPALAEAVDQRSFTLTYTPGTTGLPVVADCYRGSIERVWDMRADAQGATAVVVTLPAQPFWRDPTPVTVTPSFSGKLQVDSFDTVTGWTVAALGGAGPVSIAGDAATFVEGTGSAKVTLANSQGFTASKTISSANLTGMTVTVQGLADFTQVSGFTWGFQLTLSSSGGRSSTWNTLSAYPPDPSQWRTFGWDLTRTPTVVTSGGVDLTAVTGIVLAYNSGYLIGSTVHAWLDDLSGYPPGGGFAASSNMQLRFDSIQGSARAPVSVEVDAGSAFAGILMSNNPGAPPGFTAILPTSATPTVPAVRYQKDGATPSTYEVVIRQSTAASTSGATSLTAALVSTQSASRQFNTADWDRGAWKLAGIGQLTLPPDYVDPQNTASLVTFTESNPAGWDGLWLLDVTAETVQATLPTTTKTVYMDAPGPMDFYGKMTATATDRTAAVSVMSGRVGQAWINFTPNVANYLLVAIFNNAAAGGPTLTGVKITYYPRWHFPERPY